jgi:hypothetical protein
LTENTGFSCWFIPINTATLKLHAAQTANSAKSGPEKALGIVLREIRESPGFH